MPDNEHEFSTKVTAADLLGSNTIGNGMLVTNVIMVVTAVDMATGEETPFIVEDDNLPTWKAYGLLAFAAETYFSEGESSDDI